VNEVVYMDVCCLKRAFDDQRSARVQLETAAVAALVGRAEQGAIRLVRSPAHVFENDRNPREDRRLATALWLGSAAVQVPFSDKAAARGKDLAALGFSGLDALHVAFAEEAGARWLATTDDRLISLGQRHREALSIEITNPTRLIEVLLEGTP
jgi:predicted nucleic acid-binding protein